MSTQGIGTIELISSLRKGHCPPAQTWALAEAVEMIAASLKDAERASVVVEIHACLKALNDQRHFRLSQRLGEAWTQRFGFDPIVAKRRAQALIGLLDLDPAEALLKDALAIASAPNATAIAKSEVLEYHGLLGRIEKQRFVVSEDAEYLVAATDVYLEQYNGHPSKPFWHGINAVALMHREQKQNIQTREPDAKALAKEIYDAVFAMYRDDAGDPRFAATLSEASLALGNCDDAELWLYRFIHHPKINRFALDSYARQLREIWQGSAIGAGPKCANRLVSIIATHTMHHESRLSLSQADLRTLTDHFDTENPWLERNFSGARSFSVDMLKRMIAACGAIGCVTKSSGARMGSGFLIAGKELNRAWGDEPIFVTNAHVLSDSVRNAVRIDDACVCFEVDAMSSGKPTPYRIKEVLYTSPPAPIGARRGDGEALDVTAVRLQGIGDDRSVLKIADGLPEVGPSARAYVVGHPKGGELQVSLHDSLLLDVDADGRLIHYRTPTEPGSSGSPVFDAGWEVIALHHAGSGFTPRLNGKGFYEANEGISLSAIRRKAGH